METATENACAASPAVESADDSRTCAYCRTRFLPRRSWQTYCSPACRTEANARGVESGIEARVARYSVLKSGEVSLVVRMPPEHRHAFETLAPGSVLRLRP